MRCVLMNNTGKSAKNGGRSAALRRYIVLSYAERLIPADFTIPALSSGLRISGACALYLTAFARRCGQLSPVAATDALRLTAFIYSTAGAVCGAIVDGSAFKSKKLARRVSARGRRGAYFRAAFRRKVLARHAQSFGTHRSWLVVPNTGVSRHAAGLVCAICRTRTDTTESD